MTSPFISAQVLQRAAESRLLVAIAFHFVPDRLRHLEEVLRSLASFPVQKRDIVVFTNTAVPSEQESIRQLFNKTGLLDGRDGRIQVESALAHPFYLTWSHKPLIAGPFLAADSPYTHFIYLEDDLGLTFENFAYFFGAREILRPFANLVPSFLRTEWSAQRACRVNTDHAAPICLDRRPFIVAGDFAFVGADVPYSAGFILDQDLAREYAASASFNRDRSRKVSAGTINYGVRERAAMGLIFENAPVPFVYRVVVPVAMDTRIAPECAWLAHLPNNYAENPNSPFGKIPMKDLFVGNLNPKCEINLPRFSSARQKVARSLARGGRKLSATLIWQKRDLFERLGRMRRTILGQAPRNASVT